MSKKQVIMKISNIIFIVLGMAVVGFATLFPDVNQKEKESTIVNAVMYIMNNYHYKPQDVNDEFSKKAYGNYIKYLDGSKRFFLQSEIDVFNAHELEIDDYIKSGNMVFFDNSVTALNAALDRSHKLFDELIDLEYDIQKEGTIIVEPDEKSFAKDESELRENWRKTIQYDIVTRLEEMVEDNDKEEKEEDKKDFITLKKEAQEKVKESFTKWYGRLDKVKRNARFETYLNAVTSLFDPHTSYFSPREKEDFDIRMGGKLEGIGAQLRTDGDYTKVIKIIPGGPASKGKELEADDMILSVRQEEEEASVSLEGMVISDVVQLIRGEKGTIVFLTVKKADGTKTVIQIERDEVILDASFARSYLLQQTDIIDNVGYIKLPKFYSSFEADGNSCFVDVAKEVEKLKEQNVKGIIIDLRYNSGGSLSDVVKMSGLFIEKGPITQVQGRNGKSRNYSDTDKKVQYDGPLLIMTNRQSASASEILAAAMQDYGRAIIVGSSSTFGKGTVQRFFDLDKVVQGHDELKPLGQLKMSMQKFFRINGGTTQLTGVVPDIILPDNYQFLEYGEKEYDYPLEWSEIEPAKYAQDVTHFHHKEEVVQNSNTRVAVDTNFMKVIENAKRLKRNSDISQYPLSYDMYDKMVDTQAEEGKQYKKLYKRVVPGLVVTNLSQDNDYINSDDSRKDRNEKWLENMHNDFYLKEVLYVMRDMIDLEEDYTAQR